MRVLEVGPGDNPAVKYISDPDVDYVGVGPIQSFGDAKYLLDLYRTEGNKVRLLDGLLADALDAITDLGSFDLVLMSDVIGDPRTFRSDRGLGKVESLEALLGQASGCLADQGKIKIVEMLTPNRVPLERTFRGLEMAGFEDIGVGVGDEFKKMYDDLYGEELARISLKWSCLTGGAPYIIEGQLNLLSEAE